MCLNASRFSALTYDAWYTLHRDIAEIAILLRSASMMVFLYDPPGQAYLLIQAWDNYAAGANIYAGVNYGYERICRLIPV